MSLIKEFAIEPEVMATWAHFNALWKDFGIGEGRLISLYPLQWKGVVRDLADKCSPPIRANSIKSKIGSEPSKFMTPQRHYDGKKLWIENAEVQQATNPFHAIIAGKNPHNHGAVLVAGDFDPSVSPFLVERWRKVPRSADELAKCARQLICEGEELYFIDPHFDAAETRFVETFKAVLGMRRIMPHRLRTLEIHTEKKPTFDQANREYYFRNSLEKDIPRGLTMRVYFWEPKQRGEKMHPRFLLTELGGIKYDYGLDQANIKSDKDTTYIELMQHSFWQQVRSDYSTTNPAFLMSPGCILEIRGQG